MVIGYYSGVVFGFKDRHIKGFDTYGLLKLIGGINKGRSNKRDLGQERIFAYNLLEKLQNASYKEFLLK